MNIFKMETIDVYLEQVDKGTQHTFHHLFSTYLNIPSRWPAGASSTSVASMARRAESLRPAGRSRFSSPSASK